MTLIRSAGMPSCSAKPCCTPHTKRDGSCTVSRPPSHAQVVA